MCFKELLIRTYKNFQTGSDERYNDFNRISFDFNFNYNFCCVNERNIHRVSQNNVYTL